MNKYAAQRIVRYVLTALTLFSLSACGGGGSGGASASPPTYSIVATVTGLSGAGLVLQNNGTIDLPVGANGTFNISTAALSGSAYALTVKNQPRSPAQTCVIANGSGVVATNNVSNITVTCIASPTVTLSASATAVYKGDTVTLTWSSTNATACVAGGAWTGNLATSGSQAISVTNLGVSTYLVNCGTASATASVNASSRPVPTTLVPIQTYERSSTVAYPAVITAAYANIASEIISVPTPAAEGDYSQLAVTKMGFQPNWYPYTSSDTSVIQIGLYKTTTINKQAGFSKAIIPHDAGGWLMDYYNRGYFPSTLDRIQSIGANTVVYADSAFIKSMDISAKTVTLYGKYFPPDQVLIDMGNLAKARDLDFTFMLGIYPGDILGNDSWTVPKFYAAIGALSDADPFWDAWFVAYKSVLVERAILAQKVGATRFVIGFNLGYMTKLGNQRWAELISAIRSAGYRGKVGYFSNTGGARNDFINISDATKRNEFMRLFDEVGLDIYAPIISSSNETLSSDQARSRIYESLKMQVNSIQAAGVPILLMIGTPSVHTGTTSSNYTEPSLSCDQLKGLTRDYATQADVYEAAAQLVNDQEPNAAGSIKGIFSWGYHYIDNPRKHTINGDACFDFSASIRNKPAEAVMSYWFSAW